MNANIMKYDPRRHKVNFMFLNPPFVYCILGQQSDIIKTLDEEYNDENLMKMKYELKGH